MINKLFKYKSNSPYSENGMNKVHTVVALVKVTAVYSHRAEFEVVEILENICPPQWSDKLQEMKGGFNTSPSVMSYMHKAGMLVAVD